MDEQGDDTCAWIATVLRDRPDLAPLLLAVAEVMARAASPPALAGDYTGVTRGRMEAVQAVEQPLTLIRLMLTMYRSSLDTHHHDQPS